MLVQLLRAYLQVVVAAVDANDIYGECRDGVVKAMCLYDVYCNAFQYQLPDLINPCKILVFGFAQPPEILAKMAALEKANATFEAALAIQDAESTALVLADSKPLIMLSGKAQEKQTANVKMALESAPVKAKAKKTMAQYMSTDKRPRRSVTGR